MPVITLSRQLGSQGDDVAAAVAQRLGLRLVGREVINRAAREAGAPEVALAAIDELGLLGIRPDRAAIRSYREKIAQVVDEMAADGKLLLVGRGGQVMLAGRPGVLHVRVLAPRPMRIACVARTCNISTEAATARVEAADRARADFVKRYYGVRQGDPELYDIVLNMAQLDVETATDLICRAAQWAAQRGSAAQ
jgi:cytidylate kinase